jgi:hypothetical protein
MTDEYEYVAKLEISPEFVNREAAAKEIEDLSWEHAKEFAEELGFGIGTDEFIDIYNTLKPRYEHQIEHMKFFMLTALITVRELLQNNLLTLPIDDGDRLTEVELVNKITDAAQCIVGSYMWLSASHEMFWPEDDMITTDTAVAFHINPDDIILEEEL